MCVYTHTCLCIWNNIVLQINPKQSRANDSHFEFDDDDNEIRYTVNSLI